MKQYDKWAVKRYRQVWLWLVLWVAFLPATQAATNCNVVTEIPVSECQSLLELYNSTNGPNWRNNTGWNQTNMPCSWHGITCGAGHVTEIHLSDDSNISDNIYGNGLTGQIPDLNLPSLTQLTLWENPLSGSIPNFSNLPNLKGLTLSHNQLTGNIPNFSNLPNLKFLVLESNRLNGNIPNFSNIPNLTILALDSNQLSGNIPNFSNLPNLNELFLGSNQLTGNVLNFSNLPNLTMLTLDSNQLSGSIPNFNNLPNLNALDLSSNQLTGNIPNFSNLLKLNYLNLSSNQLSGNIPNFTAFSLANLEYAKFYNNCGLTAYDAAQESVLNSKDPDWQTRNPDCSISTVTDCNVVMEIPASECRSLLDLYNSTGGTNWTINTGWNRTNTPCSWHGITCSAGHVTWIDLSDDDNEPANGYEGNGLVGQIPDLNLPELTVLSLWSDQLSGSIPDFSHLPNLAYLTLQNNQLSGNVPDFSNLSNLRSLNLAWNQLIGDIPENFSYRFNLTDLYLSGNQLSGNIPNFSNLPNLEYLALSENQLSGSIPNFSNLPKLRDLFLSGNQLSGNIPSFSNVPNLTELTFDHNQLSGNIPNFSNLPNLKLLFLHYNQLSGSIHDFSHLPNLKYLGLRGNKICKDSNIDYSAWPIEMTFSDEGVTWQEQLDTFPYCSVPDLKPDIRIEPTTLTFP